LILVNYFSIIDKVSQFNPDVLDSWWLRETPTTNFTQFQ
jgi:hypothetical protein